MRAAIALLVLSLLSVAAAANAGEGFSLKDQAGDHMDIVYDGKIIARYMYAHDTSSAKRRAETFKPYLHIYDEEGKAPITKGPGGLWTHHRGIFVGWRATADGKKVNRWEMEGGDQVHVKFLEQKADEKSATITSLVEYQGENSDPKPFLTEERTMTFLAPTAPAYCVVDVSSKVTAQAGTVELGGDSEHGGMQYRPSDSVREGTTYIFPKENADPHKDKDYPWVGETYKLGDKHYSVIDLNSPKNPKNTPFSAYRNYGRFGGFFKGTLTKGGELTINCRFIIAAGDMPPAEFIQKAYNQFAGTSDPVPKTTVRPADK